MALSLQEEQKTLQTGQGALFKKKKKDKTTVTLQLQTKPPPPRNQTNQPKSHKPQKAKDILTQKMYWGMGRELCTPVLKGLPPQSSVLLYLIFLLLGPLVGFLTIL